MSRVKGFVVLSVESCIKVILHFCEVMKTK